MNNRLMLVLLVVLVLLLVGVFPLWPHASGLGYWPASTVGLVLLVVVIVLLLR